VATGGPEEDAPPKLPASPEALPGGASAPPDPVDEEEPSQDEAAPAEEPDPDAFEPSKVRVFLNPSFYSGVFKVGEEADKLHWVGVAPLATLGAQYINNIGLTFGGAFGVAHRETEGESSKAETAIFLIGRFGYNRAMGKRLNHRISVGMEAGLYASLYSRTEKASSYSSSKSSINTSVETFIWGGEFLYHYLPFRHVSLDLGFRINHVLPNESTTTTTTSWSSSYSSGSSTKTTTLSVDQKVIFSLITGISIWI